MKDPQGALAKNQSLSISVLINRYDFFLLFLLRASLAGLMAGLVGVAFRLTLTNAELWRNNLLTWAHNLPRWGWLILPLAGAFAGGLAGWLTGVFAPEASGSGIPHIEAVLVRQRKMYWWRVLPTKFIGGALAIGAGLSLGREGPTVQMGAAAAQAVSKSLSLSKTEELQLMACGAGAGLAAAFNAPLAGTIFVLEELRRNFSPYVLGGALVASIAADFISQRMLGPLPTFKVAPMAPLPQESFAALLVLGILTGVMGTLFNQTLLSALQLSDRAKSIPRWWLAAGTTFAAGVLGYYLPHVLGGGHALVEDILSQRILLAAIPILFVAKFFLTMASYSVGVPGGIFLPLLTLGALLGSLVGNISSFFLPGGGTLVPSFAVIGMAAYFVAIVRSPLTGIILTIELTGNYQHMLYLLFTIVISYLTAEAFGTLPVYEMLLERDLMKEKATGSVPDFTDTTILMEIAVESGSRASGMFIKDLNLPSDCLLVSVKRGTQEIIPRGHVKLIEGDQLRIILPEKRAAQVMEEVSQVTRCQVKNGHGG